MVSLTSDAFKEQGSKSWHSNGRFLGRRNPKRELTLQELTPLQQEAAFEKGSESTNRPFFSVPHQAWEGSGHFNATSRPVTSYWICHTMLDGSFSHHTRRIVLVPRLVQTGLWRWMQSTGIERFELLRMPHEWVLRGTIIAPAEAGPAEARYEILCDDSWQTRRGDISLRDGTVERVLQVTVEDGQWYANGHSNESLAGCRDIDLEWSPSTNTIPIRRLRLPIGETSGPLIAAWVRFPHLTLQPLPQEYERISELHYRYSSNGGKFVAEIVVDEEGLVVNYEGLWQRAAPK